MISERTCGVIFVAFGYNCLWFGLCFITRNCWFWNEQRQAQHHYHLITQGEVQCRFNLSHVCMVFRNSYNTASVIVAWTIDSTTGILSMLGQLVSSYSYSNCWSASKNCCSICCYTVTIFWQLCWWMFTWDLWWVGVVHVSWPLHNK